MKKLTEETMWEAVIGNKSEYDGVFYYGVKTTGIFCKPSCKSKAPSQINVRFFANTSEALKGGFRPCKRCRPDLTNSCLEPADEINIIVLKILNSEYGNPNILSELPVRVSVSPFHLQRQFKKQNGVTPKVYLQQVRINKALELLKEDKFSNLEICMSVGFQSLSCFYSTFRSIIGLSPKEYKSNYYNKTLKGGVLNPNDKLDYKQDLQR